MNILFVDDDKDRVALLTRYACRMGHISSVAYNHRVGAEYAKNTRFDLVIVNVPHDVDGSEALHLAIEQNGYFRDIVLIELPAMKSMDGRRVAHYPVMHIDQPIDAGQLANLLSDCRRSANRRAPNLPQRQEPRHQPR